MTATDDALYLAVRERCWQLEPQTGQVVRTFDLPDKPKTGRPLDWGYIACVGDTLFGSAVLRGGLFLGADGEWYDRPDEESQKVVSKYLFALDRKTGKTKWVYRGGVIINPTLNASSRMMVRVRRRS